MGVPTSTDLPRICGRPGVGHISPDPDIAGIGVILAFLIIGSLTMVILTIRIEVLYWHNFKRDGWIPRELFYPEPPLNGNGSWPGLEEARNYIKNNEKFTTEAEAAVSSTIFGLGDTQFATGIAISAAVLSKPDITSYHYFLCLELVWLAFISSTAALLATRTGLVKSNVAERVVRIVVMWCLYGLLVTVDVNRNDIIGLADEVFPAGPYWYLSNAEGIMSLILFASTAITVVIETIALVPTGGLLMYHYVEWRRKDGRSCMEPDDRLVEDEYGFGQVVAMTLLISPIISNADCWYGVARDLTRRCIASRKFDLKHAPTIESQRKESKDASQPSITETRQSSSDTLITASQAPQASEPVAAGDVTLRPTGAISGDVDGGKVGDLPIDSLRLPSPESPADAERQPSVDARRSRRHSF